MFNTSTKNIIIFIICVVILIAFLCAFIVTIIYLYQKRQLSYLKEIEESKVKHENTVMESKLEIQEQTFYNISKEIHNNIGQKLTLAKLQLNTLTFENRHKVKSVVTDSVNILSEAMSDLSTISRSMSSEIINNYGLITALEFELEHLKNTRIYKVSLHITGEPVFLAIYEELVLFRIVQESLTNIIKHAVATEIAIRLHYCVNTLILEIKDNGIGFMRFPVIKVGSGLNHIKNRCRLLHGTCEFSNDKGAKIKIEIPIDWKAKERINPVSNTN